MEWLYVHYWRRRRVYVDGEHHQYTNEVIPVTEGRHRVTLSPPPNFKPSQRTVTAQGTTPQFPVEIEFTPVPSGPRVPR